MERNGRKERSRVLHPEDKATKKKLKTKKKQDEMWERITTTERATNAASEKKNGMPSFFKETINKTANAAAKSAVAKSLWRITDRLCTRRWKSGDITHEHWYCIEQK